jgi:biopolymer transport protein TolR
MRQHSKSAKLICRIDDSAFAAIMCALVAMFLLAATLRIEAPRMGAHLPLDFAYASHSVPLQKALREDALFVAVTRDGKIYFENELILPQELPTAIRERLSRGAESKVYIRADARTKYGNVEVVDGVHSAGIEDIAFLVNEQNSAGR